MKNKIAIFGLSALFAAASTAHAGRVSFSFGASIGIPAPVYAAPVYAPPPVHYAPPPPVVVAAPRVVYSAPVVCAAPVAPPAPYYGGPPAVVYAPPVYVAPPRVVYAPAPRFGFCIGFGHLGLGHGRHQSRRCH